MMQCAKPETVIYRVRNALAQGVDAFGLQVESLKPEFRTDEVYGPGNDLVFSTALTTAGAHIILFTTGRGTPFGASAPTVKSPPIHRW